MSFCVRHQTLAGMKAAGSAAAPLVPDRKLKRITECAAYYTWPGRPCFRHGRLFEEPRSTRQVYWAGCNAHVDINVSAVWAISLNEAGLSKLPDEIAIRYMRRIPRVARLMGTRIRQPGPRGP
jgi:hypothetical protein